MISRLASKAKVITKVKRWSRPAYTLFAVLFMAVLCFTLLPLPVQIGQFGAGVAGALDYSNIYRISVDTTAHTNYGFSYPITYQFSIPAALSNATAYHCHALGDAWVALTTKESANATAPTTFYEGIECARFDYTNDKAYISLTFASDSDLIYLKVEDSSNVEQAITYESIPQYYDNRKMLMVFTVDDCEGGAVDVTDAMLTVTRNANVVTTLGITVDYTGGWQAANWTALQANINDGLVEIANHSYTHTGVPYADYDYEITGAATAIVGNLTLPAFQTKGSTEYLWAWIQPGAAEDNTVRTKIGQAHYLVSRNLAGTANTWVGWNNTYGIYDQVGITSAIYNVNLYDATTLAARKAEFDTAYNAGDTYHGWSHNTDLYNWWYVSELGSSGYFAQFMDYCGNRTDVWYAGLGTAYLYHYGATSSVITVSHIFEVNQTFSATKDTALNLAAPDTNYGTTNTGVVNAASGKMRTLLEFDLSAFSEVMVSATLTLNYYYKVDEPSGLTVDVYKGTHTYWVEAEATWKNYVTSSMTLGTSTTSGSTQGLANYLVFDRWQATANGTVYKLNVYCGGSGNVKAAIYADSSGSPGSLLSGQPVSTACVISAWNDVPLGTPVTVTSGTWYWLADNASLAVVRAYLPGGATSRKYVALTYANAFPNPAGSLTNDNTYWDSTRAYVGAWESAGGGGDYVTSNPSGANTTVPADYGDMSWDVTDIVQDALDNVGGIVELEVKFDSEAANDGAYFRQKEYTDNPLLCPRLVVVYNDVPDISNTPSLWNAGVVQPSQTYWANGAEPGWPLTDGNCTGNVTNLGASTLDYLTGVITDFSGGTAINIVSTAPGANEVRVMIFESGAANSTDGIYLTNAAQNWVANVTASESILWELKLETGSISTFAYGVYTATLTFTTDPAGDHEDVAITFIWTDRRRAIGIAPCMFY